MSKPLVVSADDLRSFDLCGLIGAMLGERIARGLPPTSPLEATKTLRADRRTADYAPDVATDDDLAVEREDSGARRNLHYIETATDPRAARRETR